MTWRVMVRLDSGSELGEEERWLDFDDKGNAEKARDVTLNQGLVLISKEDGSSRGWPASSVKYVDMFLVKDEDVSGLESDASEENA